MLSRLFFVSCCVYVCLAADYDIIWDQNYCADQDRYPSSYKLPHNSPCSLCIDDVITFRINSTSNIYENLYRVPSETAMMNCDASTNENTNIYAFNDKQEITIRAGGSEPAFSFLFRAEPYYFISTSDGTQTSAENDLSRSPNTCLQFTFTVRLSNDQSCGTYAANCNFTTVFTDPPSLVRCLNNSNPLSSTTCNTYNPTNTPNNTMVSPIQIPLCYVQGVGYVICSSSNTNEHTWLFWLLLFFNIIVGCTIIHCSLFGVVSLPLYWLDIIPMKREYSISCKVHPNNRLIDSKDPDDAYRKESPSVTRKKIREFSPNNQSKDLKECPPPYQEPADTYIKKSPNVTKTNDH
eukprot:TRINITY_DN910_c0_g1_i5.p1 TRINITY_DN910_c0_g1~~TRINITY_DN910_c0_g1_i5.p1  ORF type:complete len:350 (+),score=22.15 TRINITY_DN910_c0_g1_i5:106-1155(+)